MGSLTMTPQVTHFVLFPFMAQGHLIPMADIAKLLASRPGVHVTIVTTPINAARIKSSIDRAVNESHLLINLVQLRFPCSEAGLPENCESCDLLPSLNSSMGIFKAAALMEPEVESLFETLNPPPSCIISDFCLAYTNRVAKKFSVPRISFHGFCCFSLLCLHCIKLHGEEVDRLSAGSDDEYFVLPGFPGGIEYTRAQLPMRPANGGNGESKDEVVVDDITKAESEAYGVIVNTFEELEAEYLKGYKEAKQGRVWCVGPVSLTNQLELDKLERGNSSSSSTATVDKCISWLNEKEENSVIYVCLGSICNLSSVQLIELALGLEASEKEFVWAIRETEKTNELFEWMADEGFEERVSGKGMVIRGWVPQGHMIPMVDIAKLLASRPGVLVTLVTTPVNAARFKSPIDRAINELGLSIKVVQLRFPCSEAGLPENCENADLLPSFSSLIDFFVAAALMEPEVETLFETLKNPPPSCIISDFCLPYTNRIAKKFDVPRISFQGFSCFSLLCLYCMKLHRDEFESSARSSDHDYFVLPGFPGGIELTRAQLPIRYEDLWGGMTNNGTEVDMGKAELDAYGVIMNTFEELEAEYLEALKEAKQGRVWCVGPVSLTNRFELDKLERGNCSISASSLSSSSARVDPCLSWLDDKEQGSVIYVCMGSICNLSSAQLIELALGLEASNKAFVWVVREIEKTKELFIWMEDEKFEERVSPRGVVIREWAPQGLAVGCL
ncbi:unnamed protein product [Linum tenue]|uniref:Uncharacterized protein n=1 Tax=Linum tenue TaxID=586396 RepID=A0AAV0PFW8_9ROSI|nr:unnamed protein product [Linum tenue]